MLMFYAMSVARLCLRHDFASRGLSIRLCAMSQDAAPDIRAARSALRLRDARARQRGMSLYTDAPPSSAARVRAPVDELPRPMRARARDQCRHAPCASFCSRYTHVHNIVEYVRRDYDHYFRRLMPHAVHNVRPPRFTTLIIHADATPSSRLIFVTNADVTRYIVATYACPRR